MVRIRRETRGSSRRWETRGGRGRAGRTKLESLSINISDVDSTLVGEEDLISLSGRVDTDVVLGIGRVRKERLDDEGVEGSDGLLDLWFQKQARERTRKVSFRL